MNGANGMLRLLIVMTVILAAVWGLKMYRNAQNGMTKFQKVSNILVLLCLLVLLAMLIYPIL